MKRFLAPILLVVLLFPTLALGEEVTMDDLVWREMDGLYFNKFTEVPFDGKVTGQEQGSFKDGKRDGSWVFYRDNGQLYEKGTYKDGKKEDLWETYWDNGQLFEKGTYKDGKREGSWEYYKQDGTVWEKNTETYKDGVKVK